MKRVILTAFTALMFLTAQAQEKKDANPMQRETLTALYAEKDQKVIDKKIKGLLKSSQEEDHNTVYRYYISKELGDKAEETKKKIVKKFPEGLLAQQELIGEIDEMKELSKKDERFLEIYKKYPNANYGFIPFSIGKEFAAKGDENKMKFYGDIAAKNATDSKGNPLSKENVYASLATAMTESNPDVAAGYILHGVTHTKKALDEMLAYPTSNENQLQRAKGNYFSMNVNYLYALANGSNPEKGYELAKQNYDSQVKTATSENNKKDAIENVYALSLLKSKRYQEALPFIETAIKKGETSVENLSNLKTAYQAVNGTKADYPAYEAKLLAAQKKAFIEEIEKSAINLPSPEFQLKDTEGNLVKLSDYKDKVVVVDFWATWCGPCKASFPAMQKAINKYKDDPNVAFLFLHTWEKNSPNPAQSAKKYVADNNYTFKVLMDLRNPSTKESAAAMAFKVDGIPSKFIIDPKGNIRFNTSGFSADADKAVEELSYMIEFAKKG